MRATHWAPLCLLLARCSAFPQGASSTDPTPSPSTSAIPWSTKVDTLRSYVLAQPDQNATKGFSQGPSIQKTFDDGQCLQIRFYNWDCLFDIPYKMKGVAKWIDDQGIRNTDPIWDAYRYYLYGGYTDPDNGWNFYGESRLTFGACGNRGPQSACGVGFCVNQTGVFPGNVPAGASPYVDPNNRDNLCPWLKVGGSAS